MMPGYFFSMHERMFRLARTTERERAKGTKISQFTNDDEGKGEEKNSSHKYFGNPNSHPRRPNRMDYCLPSFFCLLSSVRFFKNFALLMDSANLIFIRTNPCVRGKFLEFLFIYRFSSAA